jgi:hypothetical protein
MGIRWTIALMAAVMALGAFACGDGDSPASAPITKVASPTITVVPSTPTAVPTATVVPTATPAHTPTPAIDAVSEKRVSAIEFLIATNEPGKAYVDTIWNKIIHVIGRGDIVGAVDLWLESLARYEEALEELHAPQEVTQSAAIRSTGLSMLADTRAWLEGLRGQWEAGEMVDTLMLMIELEAHFDSPERLHSVDLKERIRDRYGIDETDVMRSCNWGWAQDRPLGSCV